MTECELLAQECSVVSEHAARETRMQHGTRRDVGSECTSGTVHVECSRVLVYVSMTCLT